MTPNNTTQKVVLVNSTIDTLKKSRLSDEIDRRPSLFAFYDIRPGNEADLFFQPRSPHMADVCPKRTYTQHMIARSSLYMY